MIVMVTGGRRYDDYDEVWAALEENSAPDSLLVVGGANGADELARQVWHYELQRPYVVVPARWDLYGKRAGYLRNGLMAEGAAIAPYAELPPDICIAFPGGRGTAHAAGQARRRGIPVVEWGDHG